MSTSDFDAFHKATFAETANLFEINRTLTMISAVCLATAKSDLDDQLVIDADAPSSKLQDLLLGPHMVETTPSFDEPVNDRLDSKSIPVVVAIEKQMQVLIIRAVH